MEESIIYLLILLLCGLLFIGLGIFSIKKKTPMHFWAGIPVKPEEIRDIKAYNKANGIMWIAYGLIFILSGFAPFVWDLNLVAIVFIISIVFGTISLMIVHGKIYEKYKVK